MTVSIVSLSKTLGVVNIRLIYNSKFLGLNKSNEKLLKREGETMRNQHKKHALLKVLCVCFVLSFFISILYISIESHHECINDHCVICNELNKAQKRLEPIPLTRLLSTVTVELVLLMVIKIPIQCVIHMLTTPITNKVRMNN